LAGAPDSSDAVSYVRTLPDTECFQLLAVATVGRVGFVSPAGVQIIPVNYRLGADHQLFMKTAPGSALAQLAEVDAPVAFEVDYHADDFRIAWSVLMNGTMSNLDEEGGRCTRTSGDHPFPGQGQPAHCQCAFCRGRYLGAACTVRATSEDGDGADPLVCTRITPCWVCALQVLGRRAGSTAEERRMRMPGEEVVSQPRILANHAITIRGAADGRMAVALADGLAPSWVLHGRIG
jgi:Pyridoxamine 5'-phosphate oxidase